MLLITLNYCHSLPASCSDINRSVLQCVGWQVETISNLKCTGLVHPHLLVLPLVCGYDEAGSFCLQLPKGTKAPQ